MLKAGQRFDEATCTLAPSSTPALHEQKMVESNLDLVRNLRRIKESRDCLVDPKLLPTELPHIAWDPSPHPRY